MSPTLQTPLLNADQMADLVNAIGTPGFAAALLSALAPALGCAHLSAFVFDAQLQPHQVMAESLGGESLAMQAGRMAQAAGLHRLDPNTRTVSAADAADSDVRTTRRRAADIEQGDQALTLYTRFGLADRISLLSRAGQRWLVLNLYRNRIDGEFDSAALTTWETSARLLAALMRRHFEWQTPTAWRQTSQPDNASLEKRLAALRCGLSAREQQVCARALRGMTNPGIALDLGVQVSTVSTLRRRAFAKLHISTLSELFLLCLWPEGPAF